MISTDTAPDAPWIDRADTLAEWLDGIQAGDIVGLDTEFMRSNTFYPQLALLQLGHAGRYALIDPVAFDLGASRLPILSTTAVVTVMHSASEDLEALAPPLPQGPHTLFDTQIAAAFVGMGLGISYRALVAELVGAELDKGETRSDWLKRPLTESQRLYAALDVVYLEPIHRILGERLAERDRASWHAEDCERMKLRARQRDGDPQPQRSFKGSSDWTPERQAMLRRVLRWRETTARALDRPRPWMLDDALASSLVYATPRNQAELDERARGQRALRSAQRADLFEVLQRPVTAEEIEATAPIPGHPFGETKRALSAMKQLADQLAADLDLPGGLLCPRRALEEYVVTRTWPETLEGWRRGVLHDKLAALLPG
jgi:ribonuclease D